VEVAVVVGAIEGLDVAAHSAGRVAPVVSKHTFSALLQQLFKLETMASATESPAAAHAETALHDEVMSPMDPLLRAA
jgi:hypothetical protein